MKTCPACDGRGGFNRFLEIPVGGTATQTIHQWIPCSLCLGSGGESPAVRKFDGVMSGMEQK